MFRTFKTIKNPNCIHTSDDDDGTCLKPENGRAGEVGSSTWTGPTHRVNSTNSGGSEGSDVHYDDDNEDFGDIWGLIGDGDN